MAEIVAGFASSHTPLMSLPGRLWTGPAEGDVRRTELVRLSDGKVVNYPELLASADPAIAKLVNVETFERRAENIKKGLDALNKAFGEVNPDVVVMFGDDQNEWFFDDNMPSINVYWGDTIKMLPYKVAEDASEAKRAEAAGFGPREMDYPVDSDLGLHIIESLMERDFDVAHSRYQKEKYGGTIGPSTWWLRSAHETKPRPFGMGHAFHFPIGRWFDNKIVPIVPININTCYPPNWISPKRAYALGRAVREAVLNWKTDKRVAIACSGGLSHHVVDEEIDQLALKGLSEANGEILSALPRVRLQVGTTETLNWVATAGAMGNAKMDMLTYEPGYRTPAGTGCACACGTWL